MKAGYVRDLSHADHADRDAVIRIIADQHETIADQERTIAGLKREPTELRQALAAPPAMSKSAKT